MQQPTTPVDSDPDVTYTDKFVFFWKGWPSQWYSAKFSVDGDNYVCAEQYMMAEKARLFKDEDTREKILAKASPKAHKALGRSVKNFDQTVWEENAVKIVAQGNRYKFNQHPELKQKLLNTGDRILVEASPLDKIWGIGLAADDPRALNQKKWLGKNWLGEALMTVRKDFKNEQTQSS
eukprot:TRINITY_DN981_c0_g1_i1.p1 TRINITY_DN981_c0_g1~~TRINITY_DN981_c0_g1_i1.p1  ORF type:complete len:178 (-),score=31.46 TRINITY_DN981_c0_g1_i1:54-587(-)